MQRLTSSPRLSRSSALSFTHAFKLLTFSLLLLASKNSWAQQISITSGSASSCSGVIEDSGGPSGQYADNEDYTFTICPDVPGNVVYLTWFVFDLSPVGGNNSDYLAIYDGDNVGATSLGIYRGQELQNLIVSGTVFNTSGCLTLVFHSNGSGVGNFSCGFQCTTPCEHPTASAVMSEPVPALICQGETVQFDGSASTAASGFVITQYLWNFDDGSVDSTSGPYVSHAFQEAGEHMVQLLITDDNDCSSLNLVDQQVLVSTTPNFGLTTSSVQTCEGETVTLVGSVQPVTWTGLPDAGIGEPALLPDDVGAPYQSSLTYAQFDPGQELTNVSDFQSLCVEMEHSFMGDLVLQVICPNGQTTILHQQGGGGTFIGDANDGDAFDPEPGTCWTYCWSPTATNGTFADNSGNTVPSSQGSALTPGTYEAVQSFNNLLGCPLNGDWIFQSTDLWGADNGFICNWTINWNPAIIPDVTTYTPTIGGDADSTYWSGPDLSNVSLNGDTTVISVDVAGTYSYQYHAVDNFGCAYDTTITITVDPPVQVEAGPDQTYCNTPLHLQATTGASGMTYEWFPTTGLTNPNVANPFVTVTNTTMYYVRAYPNGHPACATIDSLTIFLDPGLDPGQDTSVIICMSAPNVELIDLLGGTPVNSGVWTDGTGATVANTLFHPLTDAAGTYTYTVTTPNGCVGSAALDITLLPLEDPTCCGIVDAGPDTLVCTLQHALSATVVTPGLGHWIGPAGAVFDNAMDPFTTVTVPATGTYTFYWNENDGNVCDLWDSVFVTFTQPITIDVTTTDAVCYSYCDGTAAAVFQGGITTNGPVYIWQDAVAGATEANASGLCARAYTLRIQDDNGCYGETTFTIGEPILLTIDSLGTHPATCYGTCDGDAYLVDAEAVDYSFDGGATYSTSNVLDQMCAGSYQVTIRNVAGCIGRDVVVVEQPDDVVAQFTWTPEPAFVTDPLISFHNVSGAAETYEWDFAGLGTSTETNPTFEFTNKVPGVYRVCMIARNMNLCPDTVCHDVEIHDVLQVFLPNSFTPDGNGLNETWGLNLNVQDMDLYEMEVYDRWGRIVFSADEPTVHWDGTYKNGGDPLPTGVYAFRMNYRVGASKDRKEVGGYVTILR